MGARRARGRGIGERRWLCWLVQNPLAAATVHPAGSVRHAPKGARQLTANIVERSWKRVVVGTLVPGQAWLPVGVVKPPTAGAGDKAQF